MFYAGNADDFRFEPEKRRNDCVFPMRREYKRLSPRLEFEPQIFDELSVLLVAFKDVFELELPFVKVDARVDAAVIATGRARCHVVCFLHEKNVKIEP